MQLISIKFDSRPTNWGRAPQWELRSMAKLFVIQSRVMCSVACTLNSSNDVPIWRHRTNARHCSNIVPTVTFQSSIWAIWFRQRPRREESKWHSIPTTIVVHWHSTRFIVDEKKNRKCIAQSIEIENREEDSKMEKNPTRQLNFFFQFLFCLSFQATFLLLRRCEDNFNLHRLRARK